MYHFTRRNFLKSLGLSSLALNTPSSLWALNQIEPEPKSIHTWFNSKEQNIYNYDVDMRITDFPVAAERRWLYYFSITVYFTDHDEWSHGGIQWSGTQEFRNNNNQGVNWGGGSDWAGYGGIGVNNTPFTWELNKWYRFRVWKVDKDAEGYQLWLFAVLDYESGEERQYGTVKTKSAYIKSAMVFTETGYGVQCDSPIARVEWRNPTFRNANGQFCPEGGTANYNGTCQGSPTTNQGMISTSPLTWFHSTNTARQTQANQKMW